MIFQAIFLHGVLFWASKVVQNINHHVPPKSISKEDKGEEVLINIQLPDSLLEIDIKAPMPVVLDRISNYNHLRYEDDDIVNLALWAARYEPRRQGVGVSALSMQRQHSGFPEQEQGRKQKHSSKRCTLATAEEIQWKRLPHGVTSAKTFPYQLCLQWDVEPHPDEPYHWTQLSIDFYVTKQNRQVSLNSVKQPREQQQEENNMSELLLLEEAATTASQFSQKILQLILSSQTNSLIIIMDAILHWVKQSSESQAEVTSKRLKTKWRFGGEKQVVDGPLPNNNGIRNTTKKTSENFNDRSEILSDSQKQNVVHSEITILKGNFQQSSNNGETRSKNDNDTTINSKSGEEEREDEKEAEEVAHVKVVLDGVEDVDEGLAENDFSSLPDSSLFDSSLGTIVSKEQRQNKKGLENDDYDETMMKAAEDSRVPNSDDMMRYTHVSESPASANPINDGNGAAGLEPPAPLQDGNKIESASDEDSIPKITHTSDIPFSPDPTDDENATAGMGPTASSPDGNKIEDKWGEEDADFLAPSLNEIKKGETAHDRTPEHVSEKNNGDQDKANIPSSQEWHDKKDNEDIYQKETSMADDHDGDGPSQNRARLFLVDSLKGGMMKANGNGEPTTETEDAEKTEPYDSNVHVETEPMPPQEKASSRRDKIQPSTLTMEHLTEATPTIKKYPKDMLDELKTQLARIPSREELLGVIEEIGGERCLLLATTCFLFLFNLYLCIGLTLRRRRHFFGYNVAGDASVVTAMTSRTRGGRSLYSKSSRSRTGPKRLRKRNSLEERSKEGLQQQQQPALSEPLK